MWGMFSPGVTSFGRTNHWCDPECSRDTDIMLVLWQMCQLRYGQVLAVLVTGVSDDRDR